MNYAQLLEDVKDEVTESFQNFEGESLPYHNLDHTSFVVSNTVEIARYYQLNERDLFIVETAAWFHDLGYLNGGQQDHELRGAAMAETFLLTKHVDAATILQIKNCILATRIPQQPHNLLEQIVCDADLFHLGSDNFRTFNKKMKKESEIHAGKKIDKDKWRKGTLHLLNSHYYHTDYVKNLLDKTKQENLNSLKLKETDSKTDEEIMEKPASIINDITPDKPADKNKERDKEKDKEKRPDRGIETMFRITSNNHQRLSDMADNKAHIMITTTSIILSILLSVLIRKLEDNHYLIIPVILLLLVCVVTMVFSILATRPALPAGRFTQRDIKDKKTNLLFFGNFYKMSYEEYNEGMEAMMNDRDFLYGSLTRDVYSQGIVLGRKYWLLRLGYNVFMYGIICSVLAFLIAVITAMSQ